MRHRCTGRWWAFTALVLTAAVGPVSQAAAQSDVSVPEPTGDAEQPSDDADDAVTAPANSTEVRIAVWVEQILGIDERNSRFEVDATLRARWTDKRGLDGCDATRVSAGDQVGEKLNERWAPEFVVTDGRGPRVTTARELTVTCDGAVTYHERFVVSVTQRFTNLNAFPFDEHEIRFTVEPFGPAGVAAITFAPFTTDEAGEARAAQKRADKFESEEWNFTVADESAVPAPQSITTRITIDRGTWYYWINVIAPLVLIVSISWIVFWMKPVLHERLGVSITVLLTVVAFDFLTDDSLPRLPFTTRIDQFYNVSYGFVALSILASLVAADRLGGRRQRRLEAEAHEPSGAVAVERVAADTGTDDGVEPRVAEPLPTEPIPAEPIPAEPVRIEHAELPVERESSEREGVGRREPTVTKTDRVGRVVYFPAYLVCVIAVLNFGVGSPGRGIVETEPDRTVADTLPPTPEAGIARLAPGVVAEGRIESPGDRDEYEICGSAEDARTVTMRWVPGGDSDDLDPYLELYDATDRSLVTSDDDGAGGIDAQVVVPVGERCYVLVARDRLADVGVGDYELTVTVGDAPAAAADAASGFSEVETDFGIGVTELSDRAVEVAPGGEVPAAIETIDDVHAYRVCGSSDGDLLVGMNRSSEAIDTEFDPFLVAYTEDGSFVGLDDDGGVGDRDSLLVISPGDECFLVIASDLSGEATGKYVLSVDIGDAPVSDDDVAAELADVEGVFGVPFAELSESAVELGPDSALTTSVEAPGELDSYLICGVVGGATVVEMSRGDDPDSTLDPFVVLYATDGSFVAFDDDSAGDFDSRLRIPSGDDCFVLLAGDLAAETTGNYTISTSTE